MIEAQSFNRYAYLQNYRVNFVDPMALCPDGTVEQLDALGVMQCVGVGTQSVTINTSGGGRISGVGGTSSGAIEIETTASGPTEAEIVPQNPAHPHGETGNLPFNSCTEFVEFLVNDAVAAFYG